MPSLKQAREWYDPQDPVHGFDHVQRVLRLARRIGQEEGADLEVLEAAALLHDVADAAPVSEEGSQTGRASHERASAAFARQQLTKEGWEDDRIEAVTHCIEAHRYRGQVEPESLEARVLFDADKLDVIGAFGIARTLGYAHQAGQPVYAGPSERFLQEGRREAGEPHSAYHEYLFKLRKVRARLHTDSAKNLAAGREDLLHQFFEQLRLEAEGEL